MTQMSNIRNDRGDITANPAYTMRIIRILLTLIYQEIWLIK